MPDIDTIFGNTEKFLESLVSDHEKRIAEAVAALERKMVNLYQTEFSSGKGKFELAQAQSLHKSLINEIDKKYSTTIEGITKEYIEMKDRVVSDLSEFDIPVSFTKADIESLEGLRQSTAGLFNALGAEAAQKISQSLYTAVVAGTDFATLTETMRDALDTNMKKYAGLYAHDSLHQYYQTLNIKAAEKAGVETFLWAGNLRTGSRAKCVESANKVFTRTQIDEMDKEKWDGKHKNLSVWIAVGGYHCHHHLIPYIDEEAIDDSEIYLEKLSDNADIDPIKIENIINKGTPKELEKALKSLGANSFEKHEDFKAFIGLLSLNNLQKARDLLMSNIGTDLTAKEIKYLTYKGKNWVSDIERLITYKLEYEPELILQDVNAQIKKERIFKIVKEESRANSFIKIIDDNSSEREIQIAIDGHVYINSETLSALEKTGYKIKFKEDMPVNGNFDPINNLATISQLHRENYEISKTVAHEAGHAYDSLLSKMGEGTLKHGKFGVWKPSALVTEIEASEYKLLFEKQLTGGTHEIEGWAGEIYFNGNFLNSYEGRYYGEASGIGEEFFVVNSSRYSDYLLLKNNNKAKERLSEMIENRSISDIFDRKKTKAIEKALSLKTEKGVNNALALVLSEWGEAKKAYPEFTTFLEDLYSRKP